MVFRELFARERKDSPAFRAHEAQAVLGRAERKDFVLLEGWYQNRGAPLYPRRNQSIERTIREAYEAVVWVWKCVNAKANSAADLSVQAMQNGKDVIDEPTVRLLNGQANTIESGRQFRYRLSQQIDLSNKGAFVEVTRDKRNNPLRFDLLPPSRTIPVPPSEVDLTSAPLPLDRVVDHWAVLDPITGRVAREIAYENVLWFRVGHPIDPLRSSPPLDGAWLSVELDFYARLYNKRFMERDGRPPGVLAVKGDIDPNESERIERKFQPGMTGATGTVVINVDDIDYVDTAKTPRDGQYAQSSERSKIEVLVAFGVPESQLGHASGSTFANAEQEKGAYWTITMLPHLGVMTDGFDASNDPAFGYVHDVSGIEVLHLAERHHRDELREEVEKGLRTIDSYLTEIGEKPFDVPATRTLWLPLRAAFPIAANPEDQAAVEKIVEASKPGMVGQPGASFAPGQDPQHVPGGPPPGTQPPAGPANGAAPNGATPPNGAAAVPGAKTLALEPEVKEHAEDEAMLNRTAAQVEDALNGLLRRRVEQAVARLGGTKARLGTRHWTPPPPVSEMKSLDPRQIVDVAGWIKDATFDAEHLLLPLARDAAERLVTALGGQTKALPAGLFSDAQAAGEAAVQLVAAAADRKATALIQFIEAADTAGKPMPEIVAGVRSWAREQSSWAQRLAAHVTTATVEGARTAVVTGQKGVTGTWTTRRDQKVRHTHHAADGQVQQAGRPWQVGGAELRYPGDPAGPPEEVFNCRCSIKWRLRGRFVATPPEAKRSQLVVVSRP